MSTSDKLGVAIALIIVALMALLVGYNYGFKQGQRTQDKVWCSALESAGIRMKGFPPCE